MPDFIGIQYYASSMPGDRRRGMPWFAAQQYSVCRIAPARAPCARHTALVLRSVPGMQQSVPSPEDDCCPPVTVPAMPVQIILRRSIAHGLKNRFAVRHR
jgi:hypothetical protein